MSWNRLKKNCKQSSKSVLYENEKEFEKLSGQLEQLENSMKKLYKDTKKYENMILEVNRCEKKIVSDLSSGLLCQEETQIRLLVEDWLYLLSEINPIDEDLVLLTHRALVEPLKRFQSIFVEVEAIIKKRDRILQDYNKLIAKIQKLEEKDKTGTNIVKHDQAKQSLQSLENDLKQRDEVLQSELPLLYEGRIEYLQPCLEALIKLQVEHSNNIVLMLNQISTVSKASVLPESELIILQHQRLRNIQALSITVE